jgi:beta-phosphoglucomutase family hydrolase
VRRLLASRHGRTPFTRVTGCDVFSGGESGYGLIAFVANEEAIVLGLPDGTRACLFDLDGVLTDTASVHRKAWEAMFDAYLQKRARDGGGGYVAFDPDADYRDYVDGKTREDGVRSFLASRDIRLPEGSPSDGESVDTIYGLGNRKNELFQKTLETDGVTVFEGSRRYLQAVADAGLKIAVVSSSANTREVLDIADLSKYVEHRVDGVTIAEEHLAGKPAPDSYLRGAELLGVAASEAVVFEDALAGVEAGRAGHFGLVVGVDRANQADALRKHGADVVVADLADLLDAR